MCARSVVTLIGACARMCARRVGTVSPATPLHPPFSLCAYMRTYFTLLKRAERPSVVEA